MCRGAILPPLYFEPVVLPAGAAAGAVTELITSCEDLVLVVFAQGDIGDDAAPVAVGRASNAWPNGPRRRSLPLLPALRLTGVGGLAREELLAAADAVLDARQLRRSFAYDALVLRADGTVSAVFWTFEAQDPGSAAPSDPPRWSRRSHRPCPPPLRARRRRSPAHPRRWFA